jgi:2-keto-4-pentenoate hydratase/2-oxohepta-3-ene-1,7-dioic acid hydratase in catechol pathway
MNIVAYQTDEGMQHGFIEGDTVFALQSDLFGGPLLPGAAIGKLSDVTLLPPVQPSKIVCVGRNYAAHAAEHGSDVPDEPLIFLKPPSAIIAHEQPVILPKLSQRVEHEAELAVVIGKRARKIDPAEAFDHVLGYTCANDVTARDLQFSDGQWSRAKGFDTFGPLGPWIVTGLNISDLRVACKVNGDVRQEATTADMVFDVPTLIAYVTAAMTLEPGDLLLTGTPSGVSPLAAGDVVEVEIEGIGTLRNPVHADE